MGSASYATPQNYRRPAARTGTDPSEGARTGRSRPLNAPTQLLRLSRSTQLQFKPQFVQNGTLIDLQVLIDDPTITPWGLWGAVVAIVSGVALLVLEGLSTFHSFTMIAAAVTFVGLGAVVAKFGPRTSLRPIVTAQVDPSRQTIRIGDGSINFLDVTEIVYAMVRYPLEQQKKSLKVQAFSVLARVGEDVLIPIVEASPDKNHVFTIAKMLGQWTGHEVTHVGLGVQTPAVTHDRQR